MDLEDRNKEKGITHLIKRSGADYHSNHNTGLLKFNKLL